MSCWFFGCHTLWTLGLGYLVYKIGRLAFKNWERAIRAEALAKALEDGIRGRGTVAQALPAGRLKALIRLCHPDHHKNSELATETTVWLLEQRTKLTAPAPKKKVPKKRAPKRRPKREPRPKRKPRWKQT